MRMTSTVANARWVTAPCAGSCQRTQRMSPVPNENCSSVCRLLRALSRISEYYSASTRAQSRVFNLSRFAAPTRAGCALRFVGDSMLFKVVTDQLPNHLRRRQILGRAQFFKRFLLYRIYQDRESSAFCFHGSKQSRYGNQIIMHRGAQRTFNCANQEEAQRNACVRRNC
jgi:hypothetical protein